MANDVVRKIKTELEIAGEKEYNSAINKITSETKLLDAQLKELETRYANQAKDATYLAEKQSILAQKDQLLHDKQQLIKSAFENSEKAAKGYASKISDLKSELADLEKAYKSGNKPQEEYNAKFEELTADIAALEKEQSQAEHRMTLWKTKLTDTKTEINKLGVATENSSRELNKFDGSVTEAGDASEKMGKQVDKAAMDIEQMLAAAGATVGIDKLKDKMLEAEAANRQFKASVAETKTLIDSDTVSQDVIDGLENKVKAFAKEMNVLTAEVTPALYNSVSAGQDPETVFSFLKIAQKAAVAGDTDINVAADGLTSIVNAYGEEVISAEKTSDILFATVKKGKTTFGELSRSIYQVVPTAASLGVGLEDIGAAFATITARGVPTATAATQLRQVFTELSTAGSKTDKVFREITGGSFKQFVANGGNLVAALTLLEQHAVSTSTEFSDMWSSVEARNAALNLTGKATADFAANLDVMKNSAGATATAYAIMADTSEYSAKRLEVASEQVTLAIGEALEPAMKKARETGADILEGVAEFLKQNPWAVKALTVTVVTLGTLTAGLTAAKVGTTLFSATLMKTPAGLFAAGLAAVAATASTVIMVLDSTNSEAQQLSDSLKEIGTAYKETMTASKEQAKAASTEIEAMDGLVEKYDELNAKESLSAQEKEHLKTLVEELQAVYVDLDFQLDETTGKYSVLTSEINKSREAMMRAIEEEYASNKAKTSYASAQNVLEKMGADSVSDLENMIKEAETVAKQLRTSAENFGKSYRNQYARDADAAEEKLEALTKAHKLYTYFMSSYDDWLSAIGTASQSSAEAIDEVTASIDKYEQAMTSAEQSNISYLDSISKSTDNVNLLTSAMKEYNQDGSISVGTVRSLIEADEKYIQAIEVNNGKVRLNIELLQTLMKARKETELASMRAAQAEKKEAAETALAVVESEVQKLQAMAKTMQFRLNTGGFYDAAEGKKIEEELERLYKPIHYYSGKINEIKESIKDIDAETALIEALINQEVDFGSIGDGVNETSEAVFDLYQVLSQARGVISQTSEAIEEYNKNGKISVDTATGLINADERFIKALRSENGIIKLNVNLLNELTDAKKSEALQTLKDALNDGFIDQGSYQKAAEIVDALVDSTSELGNVADSTKESVVDSIENLSEFGEAITEGIKNYYEEIRSAEKEMVEDSISHWETWKEEQTSAIDEQISALDELKRKEEEESRSAELLRNAQRLEYEARMATDEYNRAELQKQAASARKKYDDYQKGLSIEAEKESLKTQSQAVQERADSEIEKLNMQLNSIDEKYNALLSDSNIQDKALALIESDAAGDSLVSLLAKYNPSFFKTTAAFESELASLVTGKYISNVMSRAESHISGIARMSQNTNITNANRTVSVENIIIQPNGSNNQQQALDLTEQFLRELNKALS